MRKEEVEIYSDSTNCAVMRHPGRRFPGVLIQGDTLYALCPRADDACTAASNDGSEKEFEAMNDVRNRLWTLLNHY
jgi:hypothetical protein